MQQVHATDSEHGALLIPYNGGVDKAVFKVRKGFMNFLKFCFVSGIYSCCLQSANE